MEKEYREAIFIPWKDISVYGAEHIRYRKILMTDKNRIFYKVCIYEFSVNLDELRTICSTNHKIINL